MAKQKEMIGLDGDGVFEDERTKKKKFEHIHSSYWSFD